MYHYCTVDVKLLLIKSYCTSFYCGYLWSDYKASTFSNSEWRSTSPLIHQNNNMAIKRYTQAVHVVFSRAIMQSSISARINKPSFTTEKIG